MIDLTVVVGRDRMSVVTMLQKPFFVKAWIRRI